MAELTDSVSSLKAMIDEMKIREQEIEQSEKELKQLEEQLKLEEKREKKLIFDNFIEQQRLSAASENLASIADKFQSNGRVLGVLIQQLSGISTCTVETEAKIEKVLSLKEKYEKSRTKYQDQVVSVESNFQEKKNTRCTELQAQIDKLLETKKKLQKKDILTTLIANGQALKTVEAQKKAVIRSADSKRMYIANMMAEVDKKKNMLGQIQEEMEIAKATHETRMKQFKDEEEALATIQALGDLNFDLEDDFPM